MLFQMLFVNIVIDFRNVAYPFREETNANDYDKSDGRTRSSHLRCLALRIVHRIL